MRIVLHVGFHKTGTTSLQIALAAHQPALSPFAHIETLRLPGKLMGATEAARAFSRDPQAFGLASVSQAMTVWVASLPDPKGGRILVSSEDFAGHMPGRFGLTDYRAAVQTVPAAVAALRDRFSGANIRVLATTRLAEPWLRSLHWQLSKHPELMLKQRRFCKDFASAADFGAVLEPLGAALAGQATLHRVALEGISARRLGPVEALYDLADLPAALLASLEPLPARNVRVTDGLADQFVRLNRAKLPSEELRDAKSAMQGMMQALQADDPPRG